MVATAACGCCALAEGERRVVATGPDEAAVLPLSATGLTVEADGERFVLAGRPSVFARVTDFAYVGRDTTVTLIAPTAGVRWRWPPPAAPRSGRLATARPRRCRSRCGAPVQSTRQVTNFMSPDVVVATPRS